MKKLIVICVALAMILSACDAVKVSAPSTIPATVEASTPDAGATIQAAVNATLTAQPVKVPEATSTPTAMAATSVVTETASVASTSVSNTPVLVTDVSHGEWVIKGTDRLADNSVVARWLARLKDPDPSVWKYFPNVPNPDVPDFLTVKCKDNPTKSCVPDGIEYGTYDSPYCWQSPCDVPVGAQEYRYISGDYKFLNLECKGDKEKGCMLILVNVMDESYTWRNQYVDNGFTLRGRYFNGDALEWGIWGLVSNGSASMLNMETYSHPGEILNSPDQNNSGANCGVSEGCKSVDVTVVVHAGDAIIAIAKTVVTK